VSEPVAIPAGTVVAGKLRVVRALGMGGMGAVYEVEHEFTKHRRALKLLHKEMLEHPVVIARFLREASAAGHIGNPHIVETFDAGNLLTGEPYIVMEMLKGETLATRLERAKRLPLVDLVDLVRQACDGVQAAHAAGIVHRDLKPENLFIVDHDGKPFVKILDFGVSKFDPSLTGANGTTKEGSALGTPYYMSPEQVDGDKDLDARTDVYALGVILYECATGKRPFKADALPKLAVLIHEGKPMPVSERRPDLPLGFVDVVHRAMNRDRDKRFQSARELAAALEPFSAKALDATMLETSAVRVASSRPPPAAAQSEPPPQPSRLPALTDAGSALSVAGAGAGETRKRGGNTRAVVWVAIAAAVLGAAGVVVGTRGTSGSAGNAAHSPPPPPSSQPVIAEPQKPATPAGSLESLTPLPSPTTAPPSVSTHEPAPPAPASAATGRGARVSTSAVPSARAAPTASTRAQQRGLAGDNPFQ
jgi:serine/threonine-protein kinase